VEKKTQEFEIVLKVSCKVYDIEETLEALKKLEVHPIRQGHDKGIRIIVNAHIIKTELTKVGWFLS
jgi:hypothetical protein